MKVKSGSEVAQSCRTLRDPIDCSPPGSSVHGILQARGLQWGAIVLSVLIRCYVRQKQGKKRKEKKATIELHFKNPGVMGKEKYKEEGC